MLAARTDLKVLGYLGRALSLEFSAVQLYSTQSRLAANWGLDEPAERLGNEATEEMGHVQRIINRMLALGVAPNASQLRPVTLGRDLHELLLGAQALEHELVRLYDQATRHCAKVGLHDDRRFFQALLEEEQEHGRALARWLLELSGGDAQETPGISRRRNRV